MSELRWHPLLEQWVVVATHRQDRPQMPANWCPFCPGSGRVPDDYDVLLYPNDFPAFDSHSGPFDPTPGLFRKTGAPGACDVVLYSPNHTLWPSHLTAAQWRRIIGVWTGRTVELNAMPEVQHVMVFENSGEAIGVTMPHPHGQIYAFPFTPPLPEKELSSARVYMEREKTCLYCRILEGEIEQRERIVAENEAFVAFVPFAARFPSEMQIYPRRHFGSLFDMQGKEAEYLAEMISIVRRKYDNLYGFLLPLMMVVRQAPAKGEHPYFHFHMEFLPLQRSATKLKYLAAVESAGGTFLNDTSAEKQAVQLRESEPKTT
jgi:UDPglucose--hexose-1-phosphate uridylyltransferase